ncbi:MAG: hypothetical protein WCQ57_09030, partial [Verrucomicrobiota bacterium]
MQLLPWPFWAIRSCERGSWNHFCSHQHAPQKRQGTGLACGVQNGNIMWLPMDLCLVYRKWGQVATKHFFLACLRRLLGDGIGLRSNLPATARVTLTEQASEKRHVLHLLHANLVQRGTLQQTHMGQMMMEVIEDLTPCCDVKVSLRLENPVGRVTLEPQGREIPFRINGDRLELELDRFTCHQMVVLEAPMCAKEYWKEICPQAQFVYKISMTTPSKQTLGQRPGWPKAIFYQFAWAWTVVLLSLASASTAWAEVSLPKIFSDGMVLQRQMKVPVWGWGKDGEAVTVEFNGQSKSAVVKDGKWRVDFDPMEAGGPWDMTVKGDNTLTVKDVLVGEVWFTCGQSNMMMGLLKT